MTSSAHKNNPFAARDTFETGSGKAALYRLTRLEDQKLTRIADLPFSIRVLLESALAQLRRLSSHRAGRQEPGRLEGRSAPPAMEIPFKPARVLLQDFTGVPLVVDLAAMRSAMQRLGGDPKRINPLIPVDLVIDHSVQVDFFASLNAAQ